ncbi:hypothetical protein JTB14_006058 [Gonioctena quinquepunctata]|nr:hypothetical protein JTB14_006058 [Gonioctena quinquepunctata]
MGVTKNLKESTFTTFSFTRHPLAVMINEVPEHRDSCLYSFCKVHWFVNSRKAYSGMYAMYCILILLTTIVASYGCLTEILDHGLSFKEAGLFLISFYCMTLLFIICNEAHFASHKMGPEFRERLLNVNLGAVDNRTRQEVNMFLTAIDKNPPIMNLNGYVDVNRKLISSTVTSMATYLVMLMQFRLSLTRNAAIAARRAAVAAAANFTHTDNATMS